MGKPLDTATVERLLAAYRPLLLHACKRHPQLDHHELRACWEDALLEAYGQLDDRASEATWVRKVFRWRLAALVKRTLAEPSALGDSLGEDPQVLNGINPEQAFWGESAMAEVLRMPPSTQTIVIAHLHGYTYDEVAAQVGLSRSTAYEKATDAIDRLRRRFGLGRDKERT